jgi:hypothetical protein
MELGTDMPGARAVKQVDRKVSSSLLYVRRADVELFQG